LSLQKKIGGYDDEKVRLLERYRYQEQRATEGFQKPVRDTGMMV